MDRGYAFLCFVLIVAASALSGLAQSPGSLDVQSGLAQSPDSLDAQSGLAKSPGSLHIKNNAAGTMTRQMFTTLSNNAGTNDPVAVPFPQGTTYVHQLLPNEYYIYCRLRLIVPSGKHEWSEPIVWSGNHFWTILSCMPNCYIVIDNRGAWQASSEHAELEYYWPWSWGGLTDSEGKMEMLGQH